MPFTCPHVVPVTVIGVADTYREHDPLLSPAMIKKERKREEKERRKGEWFSILLLFVMSER